MYRVFMSLRYLCTRRTHIIGIAGITVGVGALILILSIMSGFLDETRKTVRGSLADLIIAPVHVSRAGGKSVPKDPAPLLAAVRKDPRVAAACAQLSWFGMLMQGGKNTALSELRLSDVQNPELAGARLVGIDLEDEYQTSELRAALEREPLAGMSRVADVDRPFDPPPGYAPAGRELTSVLVGEQLAQTWYLSRGSEINLLTGAPNDETGEFVLNNRRYVVAGTFRTGENETDLNRIYMPRAELIDLLGSERQFSHVLVKLHDYAKDGKAVRDDFRDELDNAGLISGRMRGEVMTWEDFRRSLLGAIENEKVLMAIMLSLVVVVAGFTIFAILSMMVTEKRRDVGILTALGATPDGILSLFLLIGFWDALIGTSLGAFLGVWGAFKIDAIERWLSSTFGIQIFNRDVYLFDHIPSVVDPMAVLVIVAGAFACTILFAIIPAWKAGRLHPLDALRYE